MAGAIKDRLANIISNINNRVDNDVEGVGAKGNGGDAVDGAAGVPVDEAARLAVLQEQARIKIKQADNIVLNMTLIQEKCEEYCKLARATEIAAEQNKHSKPIVKRSIGYTYDIIIRFII